MKRLKHIALFGLLMIGVTRAEINELLPIPAFLVNSPSQAAQVIEEAKKAQYSPLSLADYQAGVYSLARNQHAFVLVMPSENRLIVLARSDQNLNVPMYHQDFDPVEKPKAFAMTGNFKEWLDHRPTSNTYVSDGDPLVISIPTSFQSRLFTYAPTSGMVIHVPGTIPFTTKSFPYSSKRERWAHKKVSTRGLHVTYDAIRTPQKTQSLATKMASKNVETLVIEFQSYFHPIQFGHYPTFKLFMDEPMDSLVARCKELTQRIAMLKEKHISVSLRMVMALDSYIDAKRPEMLLWNRKTNSPWRAANGATWVDLFCPETVRYYEKLAELATRLQVDELQLDYIRFPTEGDMETLFSRYGEGRPHYQAIDRLLKRLVTITNQNHLSFSADIFGIVLWENQATNDHLGQNLLTFMRYMDAVCPMTYPSHFHDGFDGIAKPGDEPFLFNQKAGLRFKAIANR
ncbi:MAG: putative glycoside hydrolase, partial [Candidatus Margulisiibacteriota bacterium]